MSVEAITWALAQRVDRSSAKFVLVAMANCAGADMTCWPSIGYLVEATCQDRKTVIENVRRLRDAGFIAPTNDHKGRTGQIAVYLLKQSENGLVKEARKRDAPKTEPVPKTDRKSPVIPLEESRFPVETGPQTGHGTVIEPSIEPSRNQKKKAPGAPEDVESEVFEDFKALRAAKRAPVTATALDGIRREAAKAGLSMQQALAVCCERGWTGFKADWLKDRGGGSRQESLEARNRAVIEDVFKGAR